jgi:hypothetical protein
LSNFIHFIDNVSIFILFRPKHFILPHFSSLQNKTIFISIISLSKKYFPFQSIKSINLSISSHGKWLTKMDDNLVNHSCLQNILI